MIEKYVYNPQKKEWSYLDPRTKVFLMALVTTLLFYEQEKLSYILIISLVPVILLAINKHYKRAIIIEGMFLIGILAKYSQGFIEYPALIDAVIVIIGAVIIRFFPIFMMGYYILKTTTPSEFISAMERMHISNNFIIPIAVMFRFFPTIKEEAVSISSAMKMRFISFGSKKTLSNPTLFLEYRLVPLIISIAKIGNELSVAAITRGLGSGIKRNSVAKVGFGINDLLALILSICLITATLVMRWI